MRKLEGARLRHVMVNIRGKYSTSKTASFFELGAEAGDIVSWTVRIAGGAK